MYAAAVKRGTRTFYFYGGYAEYDTLTQKWYGREINLGEQLVKFRTQYGAVGLQQGTRAHYDPVTDRMYITLNPGDGGGGWRTAILIFNPNTRQIESIHETNKGSYGQINNSINSAIV